MVESNVVSVFDGMGCGMLAMMEAGITVGRYVAYEIEKYAVQTSSHNFPEIEHRGDVFQADFTEFEGFDWLVGGSPCTYWSIAQKNNRETEASGLGWELFCQYVRALKEVKPKFFIYENNKSMAKAIRQSITETFGFEPICINSALVSAQNRQRLYWVGKRNEDGSYSRVDVRQPEDRGILLKDVLDGMAYREKGNCLCGNRGGTSLGHDLKKIQTQLCEGVPYNICAEPVRVGTWPNTAKNQAHDSQQYRIYSTEGKSVTLCGNGGGMGAKTGLYAIRVPEYGCPDKAGCVTAAYAHKGDGEGSLASEAFPDNPNKQVRDYVAEETPQYAIAVEWDEEGRPTVAVSQADGKRHPVYEVRDGFITIKGKKHAIKLADGFYIIRKLTVSECKRLQTVPEWFEFPVSDTQAYKMLGNGWTVSVISHIIRACLEED
jgi:DNA (cytosine-5)-methyltransferase 3A